MSSEKEKPLHVVILTGGTGRTGEQVLKAALAQFDQPNIRTTVETNVSSATEAVKIIHRAKEDQSIVCHTVVNPEIRQAIINETEAHMVPSVDLLGPVISVLDDHLDEAPRNVPGLSYALNKEQFDRIDAVDFTLAHDDGCGVKDLGDADVVLVGVSRVSKSVTSFFLAYRGIRAANVPLIMGIESPGELLKVDPNKVVALTMNPHRLRMLREARSEEFGCNLNDYSNARHIAQELRYVNGLAAQHGWRSVDVSYKSVEEVASEIVKMIGQRNSTA